MEVFDPNVFEEVSISADDDTINGTKEKPLIKQTDDEEQSMTMDKKKHWYNIAVLIVCCLMLFGGCYSKATPKGVYAQKLFFRTYHIMHAYKI